MTDKPGSAPGRKTVITALVIAGIEIGGALLLSLARQQGLIEEETVTRGVMVLIGLGVAVYGNLMPKRLEGPPPASVVAAALRQAITRVGGWAMVLGGLAFAGFWAFAPRDIALVGSVTAMGTATVVMLGYTAWRIAASRRSPAA
jgi:hypothetical protein